MQMAEPADHALGRSQGGFGTKVSLVCSGQGILLAATVRPGQRQESQAFVEVLYRARRPRGSRRGRWPNKLAADKGYSYRPIRRWLRHHQIQPVIPTRRNQPRERDFDASSYRQRNIIERVVGWFKECRAIGTRYDKLAVNYLALWILANIHYLVRKFSYILQSELSETA